MYCSNCGHIIPDGSEFCPDCGKPVKYAVVFSRESKTAKNVDIAVGAAAAAAQKGVEKGKEVSKDYTEKGKQIIQEESTKGRLFVSDQIEKAKETAGERKKQNSERTGKKGNETIRFCPNCGAPVSAGAKFCPSCGYSLSPDKNDGIVPDVSEKVGRDESASNLSEAIENDEIITDQPETIEKNETFRDVNNTDDQERTEGTEKTGKGREQGNSGRGGNGKRAAIIILIVVLILIVLFLLVVLIFGSSDSGSQSSSNVTPSNESSEEPGKEISEARSLADGTADEGQADNKLSDKSESTTAEEAATESESIASDSDRSGSASEDSDTAESVQEHPYDCGDNFMTIVPDDIILELCRDERFARDIRYDDIGVSQSGVEEINGVTCDVYQVVDISTGTVKNVDRFAFDTENDVIYVDEYNGWEADYGEAPQATNEEISHTYSVDEILDMVSICVSTFEDLPDYYWADFVSDDTVQINLYDSQNSEEPSIFAQVDADTGDGYFEQGGTDPIHFADYSPENFLIPYVGIYTYSEDELRDLAEANGGSSSQIYNFLNLAVNEIYARHGRIFSDESVKQFFESKPWYEGTVHREDIDGNEENIFNDAEYANYQMLVKLRDEYQQ